MPKEEKKNPWTTLSGEEKYDNPWINVTEYQILNPSGGSGIYGKVHFKNRAVGVIPIDADGNTWLVGQFRYTLGKWHWEICEGGGPLNEDPLDAAKRELKEETGLLANQWSALLRIHTSNSVTDEEGIVFLAEELVYGESELEATEADLKVWKLPLKQAVEMVAKGEITDGISIAGLLMVARQRGL